MNEIDLDAFFNSPIRRHRRSRWETVKKWFWHLVRGAAEEESRRLDLRTAQYRLGNDVRQIAYRSVPIPTHRVTADRMDQIVEALAEDPARPVRAYK